ncbi:MAG: LysE family translocator [Chloroflexota bacterium]
MPSPTTIGLFVFAAFLFAILPGPDMLYIATRSITQGRNAGIMSALGVQTGTIVHTVAAAAGLSALIATSTIAFSAVKYAGTFYLVYLGIRTFLSEVDALQVRAGEQEKLNRVYYQGLASNVLNPKAILFFLAFLPQFVDPGRGSASIQLLMLGLILAVVSLPVNVSVGIAGGLVGKWLETRKETQQVSKWVSGSVYIILGIGTALTGMRR